MSTLQSTRKSSLATTSMHTTGQRASLGPPRGYLTPTEKRMHYIAEFLAQLRQSDPECLVFSPAELVHIAQELREHCTNTNPWLYDVVKRIVDCGVFLDARTHLRLETLMASSGSSAVHPAHLVQHVTTDQVAQARATLQVQREMKRLWHFADDYDKSNASSMDGSGNPMLTTQHLLSEYYLTKEAIDTFYSGLLGATGLDDGRVGELMSHELSPLLAQATTALQRALSRFQAALRGKCRQLSLTYLLEDDDDDDGGEEEEEEDVGKLCQLIDTDQALRRCCTQVDRCLRNTANALLELHALLKRYERYEQIRTDVKRVRSLVLELGARVTGIDGHRDGQEQVYHRAVHFLESNRAHLSYDSLIDTLQSIATSLVVMERKLG